MSDYLLPEAIQRISRLDLRAKYVVEGFLSGQHQSRHFGNSSEFRQHRSYVPGDDPKNVDWKVWARQDRLYVKQYEVDTNLRCTLLMDVSGSMRYGSGVMTKYEYGCTLAASVAWLALRQQDAVGCITFDKEANTQIPARMRQTHLGAITTTLEKQEPAANARSTSNSTSEPTSHSTSSSKTKMVEVVSLESLLEKVADSQPNLREAFREAADVIPGHGMVVLVSDLLCDRENLFAGCRYLRSRGHDLIVFHVLDDDELDFSFSGPVRFEGLEFSAAVRCDPRSLRTGYLAAIQNYQEELRRGFAACQADYVLFRTSSPLDAGLATYLSRRANR